MTVDDWPILCQHIRCKGHASVARWVLHIARQSDRYYCQDHALQMFNSVYKDRDSWGLLTPNQRPSPVQEVQSGND